MSPEKRKRIGGHTVEKYYWAGKYPVYVDNHFTEETFEQACDRLELELDTSAQTDMPTPPALTEQKGGDDD